MNLSILGLIGATLGATATGGYFLVEQLLFPLPPPFSPMHWEIRSKAAKLAIEFDKCMIRTFDLLIEDDEFLPNPEEYKVNSEKIIKEYEKWQKVRRAVITSLDTDISSIADSKYRMDAFWKGFNLLKNKGLDGQKEEKWKDKVPAIVLKECIKQMNIKERSREILKDYPGLIHTYGGKRFSSDIFYSTLIKYNEFWRGLVGENRNDSLSIKEGYRSAPYWDLNMSKALCEEGIYIGWEWKCYPEGSKGNIVTGGSYLASEGISIKPYWWEDYDPISHKKS